MLLGSGGADSAGDRLGHALSACLRMGVLSRPGARCHGAQDCHGRRMSQFIFKMPDLGEGTVDAEIVAWHTKPGDTVSEDQLIVEVMTDKAAVEVPAPVSGRVVSISGAPGDKVAVGSPLIVFEVGEGVATHGGTGVVPVAVAKAPSPTAAVPRPGRVMASPANRRRAREAGIDLTTVAGSGPGGRILRADLGAAHGAAGAPGTAARTGLA